MLCAPGRSLGGEVGRAFTAPQESASGGGGWGDWARNTAALLRGSGSSERSHSTRQIAQVCSLAPIVVHGRRFSQRITGIFGGGGQRDASQNLMQPLTDSARQRNDA